MQLHDGRSPVDFTTGERRVQEETNFHSRDGSVFCWGTDVAFHAFCDPAELAIRETTTKLSTVLNEIAKEHGEEHEMIVLHPDHVATADLRTNDLGELEICLAIREPILFVKVHFAGVVMEERPEDGIGESVVMAVSDVIVKVHRLTRVFLLQSFVNDGAIFGRNEEAWPTDPGEVERLFEAGEGRD